MLELNVTRCYDERVIAETMGEVERMSVLPLEYRVLVSIICTQLRLEYHVPFDAMHRIPERDTIKLGRAAYHRKEADRLCPRGLVDCDALRATCGFVRVAQHGDRPRRVVLNADSRVCSCALLLSRLLPPYPNLRPNNQ